MKSHLLFVAFMILPLLAQAETVAPAQADFVSLGGQTVPAGNPIDANPNVKIITQFKSPVLWLFRSKAATPQGTVLVCPGGAYCALEMMNEGENTARGLNEMGFDVAILEYHIRSGAEEIELALADAVKAFHLIKSNGPALGLHNARIEIMGYSAGGHLAARTAQKLGESNQPDGLILIYPAYLNTGNPWKTNVVPAHKPGRLFALIGDKDNPDWIKGCQEYADKWKNAGGDSTFTLLPNGGHGFGMTPNTADSVGHWTDLLKTFLLGKTDAPAPDAATPPTQ